MSSSLSPLSVRNAGHVVVPSPPRVPPPRPPAGAPKPKPSPAGMLFSRAVAPVRGSDPTSPPPVTPQDTLSPRPAVRKMLSNLVRSATSSSPSISNPKTETKSPELVGNKSPSTSYQRKTLSAKITPGVAPDVLNQKLNDLVDLEAQMSGSKISVADATFTDSPSMNTHVSPVKVSQSKRHTTIQSTSPSIAIVNSARYQLHTIAGQDQGILARPPPRILTTSSSPSVSKEGLSSEWEAVSPTRKPLNVKSAATTLVTPMVTRSKALENSLDSTVSPFDISKETSAKPLDISSMQANRNAFDDETQTESVINVQDASFDVGAARPGAKVLNKLSVQSTTAKKASVSPVKVSRPSTPTAAECNSPAKDEKPTSSGMGSVSPLKAYRGTATTNKVAEVTRIEHSRTFRGVSVESHASSSDGMTSRKTSTESESMASFSSSTASFTNYGRKPSTESIRSLTKTNSSQSLISQDSPACEVRKKTLPPPPPSSRPKARGRTKYSLSDLELGVTLGTGSFGRVCFAKIKKPTPGTSEAMIRLAVKILNKDCVKRLNQIDHIKHEKSILESLVTEAKTSSLDGEAWTPKGKHPFIVQLVGTFQTQTCLFMMMEFIRGGEFFCHLRMRGHFKNHEATFYTASVASVFAFLHARDVAYRDLKPENLMLDHEGFIKVVDFGFAKRIPDNKTFTLCGTPEYIAPEVLLNQGHGRGVDWWALGILTYEMLSGVAPFTDSDPMVIYQRIVRGNVQYPTYFESDARSFLRRLLQVDLNKRFGCLASGAKDVMEHRWLSEIDFTRLMKRTLVPPVVPFTKDQDDTSCFEHYPDSAELDLQGKDGVPYTGGGDFPNFDCICL